MLIIVEGESDKCFISQYYLYKKKSNFKIIVNNGNILCEATNTNIIKSLNNGEKVCIIFDADKSYKNTIEQIRNKLGNLANQVEIFLFPDNKSNGELETLLIQIAKQNEFVECFDNYINCIESKDKEAVKNIYKKSKMYAYQEVVGLQKEIKKINENNKISRDFLYREEIFSKYFNFDSPALKPLEEFLLKL